MVALFFAMNELTFKLHPPRVKFSRIKTELSLNFFYFLFRRKRKRKKVRGKTIK